MNLFKTKIKSPKTANSSRVGSSALDPNPYLSTKKMWNDHIGDIISSKNMWQVVGVLALLITLSCVAGLVYVAGQSKFVPFVVQVDKLGQTMAAGPVQPSSNVPANVIAATLATFIQNARMVSPDVTLQRRAVFSVFSHIMPSDPANQEMNEWMNSTPDSNPFKRASTVLVSTNIMSVLAQSPDTYQVQWKEITQDRDGALISTKNRQALVTMYVSPPTSATTQEQMLRNPLGIYVKNFSWGEIK